MQIVIFTIGTEGDVRPLVALGVGLKQAGHKVRIATDPQCADLVTHHGLQFAPLRGDFLDWMRNDRTTLSNGLSPLAIAKAARRRLKTMAASWPAQGLRATEGADLLIGNGMVFHLAAALGEYLGLPVAETQLVPTLPSRQPPLLPLPGWARSLPGPINVALGHATQMLIWHILRPAYNEVVRPALRLAPYPWRGPYTYKPRSHLRLFAYSPTLVEPPASLPSNVRVTGPWQLQESSTWAAPDDLTRFLKGGPPPVYVGFGSMVGPDGGRFTDVVLQAVRKTGKRIVLASGWGGLNGADNEAGGNIFRIDRAPHDWLFPKMALAVHHGGAGTTTAAARAGIASVVVPFFGDQPFWGSRLEKLGVAPPALNRAALTADALASAIISADCDDMRHHATVLGQRMRAEDGIAVAISAIESLGVKSKWSV
ncbi:glycosyltransferase [Agrobacterium vitis]